MPRTFIDHLNHEVRSPLTVIVGMAELLSLSSLSAEQRQQLAVLRQASDSILRLMDLAVDFSRLRSGVLSLKDERFSLRTVLNQLRQPVAKGGQPRPLEIIAPPEAPDALAGDGGRLRQALAEVAAYLTEVRRIERLAIHVGAERSSARELALTFEFAPAERPSSTPEENRHEGEWIACSEDAVNKRHGLELAVAAGLAQAMNGALWIAAKSDVPVVARLTATFDVPQATEEFEEMFEESAAASDRTAKRILLAEDLRPNQQLVGSLLRRRGHEVSIAENGAEAVKLFQRDPKAFDVVILDLEMPVMDGRQAAEEIRRSSPSRSLRIIALTAHRLEGATDLIEPGQFDGALGKPLDAERLFEAVESDGSRPLPQSARTVESKRDGASERLALDYRAALKRLCGDEQLLDDLVQFFLDDSPELLGEARAAIERHDAKALERTAHSLKGLASNFGAQETVSAAAALEEIGRNAELAGAESACQSLEWEVGRLTEVLQDRIQRTRPANLKTRHS
ncbi:MAG TPA: response regulator [Pirellulales bacterium]|nr:response regulator [Pirellulales bacterium]